MKKWLIFVIILCFIAGGGLIYLRLAEDRIAPEISYSSSVVYTDGMTDEELLEGVIAIDDVDGDVSDSLTVERVVTNRDEAKATVIYVAKDSRNNIAKITRVIDYDIEEESEEESESETEKMTEKAPETEASETSAAQSESEAESDDSDIVVDAAAVNESETQTESEEAQEELAADAPRITLKQTRVTIKIGDSFEPTDYVDTITDDYDNKYTLWRRIQVEGNYDTGIAGIYQLVYYVTDTSGNSSNRATLLLIVEDED
ncbi:MAG: DUF5011 domain-containing protein [Lachnospiraceae bacterium]|nr:DUF5011 domain-containing protein [Lachnospiraceae bacterium]